MNTPRFNVFNQIHKALRALMYDTTLQLQQTDMSSAEEAAPVLAQLDLLLDIMDSHAHYEDEHILSAAGKLAPEFVAEFEQEHVVDMELTAQLREKIAAYHQAASDEERYHFGFNLLYALNAFIAFNLRHMSKEETLLNGVLWANYTDEEIGQMEVNIQQQIPPHKMPVYLEWMVKGINNTELKNWLEAVKNTAPDFVFDGLLATCQAHLPVARWEQLSQQLSEGILV